MNERDTKFLGFAKLLNDDMHNRLDFWIDTSELNFTEELLLIIAQRAYDLAKHVYGCTPWYDVPPYDSLEEHLAKVPDLTEWPAS